jgi:hypothetical protein
LQERLPTQIDLTKESYLLPLKKAGQIPLNILNRRFGISHLMENGGDGVGSVIKKRKKKMRKHKHKKLLARTRHQRRKK